MSAIIECADAAHGLGGQIISDGGCKVPGDIAKAFGGGADFVMLGGMLAGHEESGGELVQNEDGSRYKQFYGMSSETAMEKYASGVAGIPCLRRQDNTNPLPWKCIRYYFRYFRRSPFHLHLCRRTITKRVDKTYHLYQGTGAA